MNKFKQIAGYEKEKEQLIGLRDLLLNLNDLNKSGIRIPERKIAMDSVQEMTPTLRIFFRLFIETVKIFGLII